MNQRLSQLGIIGFSALLMMSVGLFAFQSLNKLSQSSILNADEKAPTSLSYETRLQKGDEWFQAGHYTEAASEYAYAMQLEPEQAAPYLKLSTTYTASNDPTKAEENAKKAYELEAVPQNLATYAHALLNSGKINEAKALLESSSTPDQSLAYVKGLLALAEGADGKVFFQEALQLSGPVLPTKIQGFLSAYETYESAQGASQTYLSALLSKALLDANEPRLAQNMALSTLKIKSDYRDLWMILGYAQLELNQLAEAEDSFKAAKKIDSIKPEVHYLLGKTHYLQKEYDDCINEMELALLYNFEPAAEAYKKMAESHSALGQYNEALSAYEAMINVDPHSITLFKEPIRIATEEVKDLDRAQTLAQKGTNLFPSEALSHSLLASVHLKKEELEAAETSIQMAFKQNAKDPEAHLIAGLIREKQDNMEGAKWEYKKAFELSQAGDPINVSAAENYNRLMTPVSE
ncbi:tetratricopeptide repeat protein [Candidatus Peregrinibacteria bacterium]|nr:MAG: tetratricopeptide repeat protein [Candidatus Peregrinibacteria bacterium]